jgi:uncharacterized protein YjbI with pentapeptide repeats
MIGVSPDHRVNIKYQAWRGKPTMKDLLEAQERGRFLHLARTMLLHAHQQWVSSNGKVGERLDLSGVDLRKADLSNSALDEANLSGARFWGADFTASDQRGVKTEDVKTGAAPSRWRALSRQTVRRMYQNLAKLAG